MLMPASLHSIAHLHRICPGGLHREVRRGLESDQCQHGRELTWIIWRTKIPLLFRSNFCGFVSNTFTSVTLRMALTHCPQFQPQPAPASTLETWVVVLRGRGGKPWRESDQ